MKKYIITLLALLCGHILTAQSDGCLIIKEYPEEWEALTGGHYYVDMNDDGEYDFDYSIGVSSTLVMYIEIYAREGACFHRVDIPEYEYNYPDEFNTFTDFDTPFNDSTLLWETDFYGPRIFPEKNLVGHTNLVTRVYKSGIRNGQEGEYYYGWMEAYSMASYNYDTIYFHLARTCYCTIPNYPLHWGQTSLMDVEEYKESNAFATVHPNPTNGMVTIFGLNLKQAEVLNALGQRVVMAKGEGSQMTVNLSGLPAGVYFVNITDEEGKKCVRKVVKE